MKSFNWQSAGLDSRQGASAERVLTEESAKRRHLVVAISGAHAYGFPSPDSDVDLKAIHIERTDRLLGLSKTTAHADRLEIVDGVEIDYTSNELTGVLSGLVAGNGNYLERVLGPFAPLVDDRLSGLVPHARALLSRRVYGHYFGFATGQRHSFEKDPTVKKLLYVLRTALTGAHLLRAGELVTDLRALAPMFEFDRVPDLIERKRAGERTRLSAEDQQAFIGEATRALALLEASRETSCLPEAPPAQAIAALEAWLIDVRKEGF